MLIFGWIVLLAHVHLPIFFYHRLVISNLTRSSTFRGHHHFEEVYQPTIAMLFLGYVTVSNEKWVCFPFHLIHVLFYVLPFEINLQVLLLHCQHEKSMDQMIWCVLMNMCYTNHWKWSSEQPLLDQHLIFALLKLKVNLCRKISLFITKCMIKIVRL